ncbi:hypothetical protein [Pontibacter russatus]|uniref:hypothetical protein n=1 Tax=Pontibacter russatus TaxID=2694929 RepID=UPI001379BC72|nr:hypothetical protein [Pontibacter russatus]
MRYAGNNTLSLTLGTRRYVLAVGRNCLSVALYIVYSVVQFRLSAYIGRIYGITPYIYKLAATLKMNLVLKVFLILLIILFIAVGGFFVFLYMAFDSGPIYSKEDLIVNFEEKEKQILEAKNYFNSIVPKETFVQIEFEDGQLGIFHIKRNGVYDSNWNIYMDSKKVDSLLQVLHWSKSELKTLKSKLDKANCVSAESGNPVTIGWQRSGMGMYFYKIFNQNLNDSLITKYNDSCTYIFYRDNVVLEFGGGAIGPQCFPSFYTEK